MRPLIYVFFLLLLLLLAGCGVVAPSPSAVVATPSPQPVGYTPPCPATTLADVVSHDAQNAYTCVTVVVTVEGIDCSAPIEPRRCIGLLADRQVTAWAVYPTDQGAPRTGQRIEVKGYVVFLDIVGEWALLVVGWREVMGGA